MTGQHAGFGVLILAGCCSQPSGSPAGHGGPGELFATTMSAEVQQNLRSRFPSASDDDVQAALEQCGGHGSKAARALRASHEEVQQEGAQCKIDMAAAHERARRQIREMASACCEAEAGTCPECWRPACPGAISGDRNQCTQRANKWKARCDAPWTIVNHSGELTTTQTGAEVWITHQGAMTLGRILGSGSTPNTIRVQDSTGELEVIPDAVLPGDSSYATKLCKGATLAPEALASFSTVSVWRCQLWTEGFFSLVFWALGFLEASQAPVGTALLIDMSDPRLRYRGTESHPNFWTAFFKQPIAAAAVALRCGETAALEQLVEKAHASQQLKIATCFGPPHFEKLGAFQGSDEATGRLEFSVAQAGQRAVQRWVTIQDHIKDKVDLPSPLPSPHAVWNKPLHVLILAMY